MNLAGAALLCASLAHAQGTALRQGARASPAQVQQLSRSAPVTIGSTSVWPMPSAEPLDQDGNVQANSTLVIRASDWFVGLSTNDLVVIYPDTGAVSAAAAGLAQQIQAFPTMNLTVLHVSTFSDLLPLYQALSTRLPSARFDLPVSYVKQRAQ
ncbi:hypothetical protein LJ655_10950 [Paraburkholderia sp. MMS20-SJTN17]|uniref:Integrating conjugative element protein n=1 Tax=Paraburkholderia translucens TaxID=2886945 RepID=A0ABS8KD68_9BURK|nr:hypothetical protein [Paraburkholderia sp. MMS20-SJTN17]MCC8402404.1 hypothetical protein [Paraburkholderia sp. MMS20-SJTN17]